MKSLQPFLQKVLEDLGTWCDTSTTRDYEYVTGRMQHEGLSFLTIGLPAFGRDFERALDTGAVTDDLFNGFHRTGGLPSFLGGLTRLVFCASSGQLLPDPSVTAVWAVRQFTLMWAKINLPCSDERVSAAFRQFERSDNETRETDESTSADLRRAFRRLVSLLWGDVLSKITEDVYYHRIIPKHGPGNTAERLTVNQRWDSRQWTERLEQEFPNGDYLLHDWRGFRSLPDVSLTAPGAEPPVRVVAVPKTLKTPRIIAIEPACMQYVQQGLLASFRKRIDESDKFAERFVGWGSQVPNQQLACVGSEHGTLATLDLKEASDRVSNQHVRDLLANFPTLARAVDSCRSRKADVPGVGLIDLARFASMGSALCFPIEAMVFCTVIFVGIEAQLNRPLTKKGIKSFLGKVRVYGDDIIVPVEYVSSVIEALEAFGLRVNSHKSFWSGNFRESCGAEYFRGQNVSIVRLRAELPTSPSMGSEIASTVSTRNQLYHAGMWASAGYLDRLLEGLIPLPRVGEQSPVLGRHSVPFGPDLGQKECPKLHRPLVRGYTVKPLIPEDKLDGWGALHKCLSMLELRDGPLLDEVLFTRPPSYSDPKLRNGDTPLPGGNEDHLNRAGRPKAVTLNLGWAPAV